MSSYGMLPPAIKNIIFINAIVFVMQLINPSLDYFLRVNFALMPNQVIGEFKIWQMVTWLFLHAGFMHLFFNMFALWMFGAELERAWGSKDFLKFYFITGIGSGVFVTLFSSYPTIGASGAVFGIMVAFAMRFPDAMMIFPFPMKVKYYVMGLAALEFISTINNAQSAISHIAHLGGAVIAYVYLRYWNQFDYIKTDIQNFFRKTKNKTGKMRYNKGGGDKTEYYRKIVDELLDKINRVGYLNLTDAEKKDLEEGSRYLREQDEKKYN
jgi:membrane associated rhomboid family serine protease